MEMLKPEDIVGRKFSKVFRGYDPVEVEYFLKMLSDEFQKMEGRIKDLEILEKEKEKFKGKSYTEIISEAKSEAKKIIADAENRSSEVLEAARKEKEKIEESVLDIKHKRDKLVAKISNIVKENSRMIYILEDVDKGSIDDEKQSDNGKTTDNSNADMKYVDEE
jgi:cell division initiation protein